MRAPKILVFVSALLLLALACSPQVVEKVVKETVVVERAVVVEKEKVVAKVVTKVVEKAAQKAAYPAPDTGEAQGAPSEGGAGG